MGEQLGLLKKLALLKRQHLTQEKEQGRGKFEGFFFKKVPE